MAGCVHPVASPIVVKRGGMLKALSSFLAQLIKVVLFSFEEITVFFTPPSNRKHRHGGHSLLSMFASLLSFAHDFKTTPFFSFLTRNCKN